MAGHRAARRASGFGELADRPRWVRWTMARRRGSWTKVPLTLAGSPASSTDPQTWTLHRAAAASCVGDGAGFVLNGDGIVCLDIDHCLEGHQLRPWAADVLELVPDTYIEVSPSGTGLHVWGRGHITRGRVLAVPGGKIECYGAGRFITVTGRPFGAAHRLGDLADALLALGARPRP